jgi:hypothetical protein
VLLGLALGAWHDGAHAQSLERPASPRRGAVAVEVEAVALRTLFLQREQGSGLTIYVGPPEQAMALRETLPDGFALSAVPVSALELPVTAVTPALLARHFRAHPDAWRAWYTRYPGTAGVIERTAARIVGDSATMLIARTCGEHCQQAWIVGLVRDTVAGWRVTSLDPFPLAPW